ncbi:MAG: hypothetical protein DHS20C18_35460 [Saprospiraceae bacterium]|nr:MAG: hypothetical protein DHS20C18_35460 [Saprospiraceae bacterium]
MDKNFVSIDYYKIYIADPEIFELLKFPYSRDNSSIYCGTLPLETDDIELSIVLLQGPDLHVYARGGISLALEGQIGQ